MWSSDDAAVLVHVCGGALPYKEFRGEGGGFRRSSWGDATFKLC